MTLKQEIQIAYHETKQWILYVVRRMWLVGIKLRWNKLWIRKDEFHSSLDMDASMMMHMNEKEKKKYLNDLNKRRNIAHRRGLD